MERRVPMRVFQHYWPVVVFFVGVKYEYTTVASHTCMLDYSCVNVSV